MKTLIKLLLPLMGVATLASCVCRVQTAEAIRLHGQECEGIILKGWGSGEAEFYHADGKVYVKGVQTKLERVDCELAYYQCPSFRKGYAPVPGAPEREVYVQQPFFDAHAVDTLPAGSRPGPGRVMDVSAGYYDYCSSDTWKNVCPDPVVGLRPMQANSRAWYTAPLSVLSYALVDIPGTILGSAGGALYILFSPFESFTMQYDDWGYQADIRKSEQ